MDIRERKQDRGRACLKDWSLDLFKQEDHLPPHLYFPRRLNYARTWFSRKLGSEARKSALAYTTSRLNTQK